MEHESPREEPAAGDGFARAADVLVDVLADSGVEVVFGIPGGTIAPIYDALIDHPEIRVVTNHLEGGALFAAAGYARATGKIGVVLVTSGPGVINAMTGLASAYCEGLPVLLIAGEVPRPLHGKGALQDGTAHYLNVVGMASQITKFAVEVPDANAAPSVLRRAIAIALSGRRGPALITLPIDVASARIRPPRLALEVSTEFKLRQSDVVHAARALAQPGRRLIFAGSGVRNGDGPRQLRELAERLQCPVMTTPKGKGVFPENHPLSLGVYGLGGHPSASAYVDEGLDVLLAVGTSLGDLSTNGWSKALMPRRELIQIDIELSQIGRSYPVTLGIAAPAGQALSRLVECVPRGAPQRFGVTHYDDPREVTHGREGKIAPQHALWQLQRMLPRDTIFTCDSGEHFLFAVHYLQAREPDSFIVMSGLGAMGSGIGAAIGAQLACPDRRVVAVCGDGGFTMNAGEISTAVALHLPVVFAVLNDQRLGMVELGLSALYGRTSTFPTGAIDIAGIARAMGARALVIDDADQLAACERELQQLDGPLVLELRIDRTMAMPKNGRFEALAAKTRKRVLN